MLAIANLLNDCLKAVFIPGEFVKLRSFSSDGVAVPLSQYGLKQTNSKTVKNWLYLHCFWRPLDCEAPEETNAVM
ncbi:hypothetical protein C7B82_06905 [Stenomitos frigidus ULC18]|uniref:Uncharacterized protein n=1 Tax=Stenomitos frigidus ULC18 TaxID=2107698 RepID=A0A2T1EGR6_9CYAN|nr:hypothetical protein C7B82_06905 [Stenomitos frigidus ULC18]